MVCRASPGNSAMSTVAMAGDFWRAMTDSAAGCANTSSRTVEKNLRILWPLWLIPFFFLGYVTHAWKSRDRFRLLDGAEDRFGNRFDDKHADSCQVCIRCRRVGGQCEKRVAV